VTEEESQILVSLTRHDILDGLADGSDAVLGIDSTNLSLPTAVIVFTTAVIVFKLLTVVVPVLGDSLVILLDVLHRGYTLQVFFWEVNNFF